MNPQFSQPKGSVSKETNKDSIARKFGCKKSEVLYAKPGAVLTGYKVIYDKVSQRSYALPSNLPTGATITSLTDGILVHDTGTVDLGALAVLRGEFVVITETFTTGFTLKVKNELVSDGVNLYRWNGEIPKIVNAGSSITDTGGISSTTWIGVNFSQHRASSGLDLNAIDRRPDGYDGGITEVLTNGNDVEINKDISVTESVAVQSNQHIVGVGGNLLQTTTTAAGIRVEGSDSSNTMDYVTVNNLRSTGSTVTTEPGNEGYALFLRNTKYNRITGILADKYSGGVVAGTSKSLILRDVITHDTTFHPLNQSTRDGRGGYGVITDNINDTLIDGIIHDVGTVDNGRHVLYVSTGGYGNTNGNRNFVATNLIGKYLGKDDRNFMAVNVRKSTIFQLNNINVDGSNSGVAFNVENGDITDFIASNLQLDIIKYSDGVGVYGVTMPIGSSYVGSRYLISNFNIRVRPKDGTLTGADCVGISTSYQNGMITNGLINVPAAGSPILINDGADNTTISNIHDTILPGYTGSTAAMISFTGSAVSNITVRGISTKRPMFARLSVVTNLTVDFDRKSRISTDGSGGFTKIDANEIIGTVTLSATAATINFPTHVTQNAVENVRVDGTSGTFQVYVTAYGSKTITLAFYTPAGVLINPQTTAVTFNVILSS